MKSFFLLNAWSIVKSFSLEKSTPPSCVSFLTSSCRTRRLSIRFTLVASVKNCNFYRNDDQVSLHNVAHRGRRRCLLPCHLSHWATTVPANLLPVALDAGNCSYGARSSTLLSISRITTPFKSSHSSPNGDAINLQSSGDVNILHSSLMEVNNGLTLRVHCSGYFHKYTTLDELRSELHLSNSKIYAIKPYHEFNFLVQTWTLNN